MLCFTILKLIKMLKNNISKNFFPEFKSINNFSWNEYMYIKNTKCLKRFVQFYYNSFQKNLYLDPNGYKFNLRTKKAFGLYYIFKWRIKGYRQYAPFITRFALALTVASRPFLSQLKVHGGRTPRTPPF